MNPMRSFLIIGITLIVIFLIFPFLVQAQTQILYSYVAVDGFPNIQEYQGNSDPLDENSLPEGILSWDVPLSVGWNAVGLALDVTPLKAHNACGQIGTPNVSVKELDHFIDGAWAGHVCGLPFNDFTFSPGRGYFILAVENTLWTQRGFDIPSPLIMNIKPGWNVISLPRWTEDSFTAQRFLNEINKQGGACTEIDRFTEGGVWEACIDGIPINDFILMPGEGYALKCEKPAQLSISFDRDPPLISDITITPTTSEATSEASITWTTNEPASTEIHYGPTPNCGFIFTDPALVLSHSKTLTGLYPGTTFHIKIISRDDSNNIAVSEDYTFTTPEAPVPIAVSMRVYQNEVSPTPDYDGTDDAVISGLPHWDPNANTGAWEHLTTYADSLGKNEVLIRLELEEIPLGAPILYASLSLCHFLSSESPQEVTAFRITKGWVEGTGWRISPQEPTDGVSWVKAGPGIPWDDEGGDVDQGTDFGLGPNGLVDSHTVEPLNIPESWEDWDITPLVRGWVNGEYPNNGLMLMSSGDEGIAHRYRSRNYKAHPESRPRLIVFYGEEPSISPAGNLNAQGEDDSIYLTWENPPDKIWSGTRIVRNTSYYPLHENDGVIIYDGKEESYNDQNVVSRQMYYYTAFAYDDQGNFSLPLPTAQSKGMIYCQIGQPGNFKAVPGNKEINLSWQNPFNDPYWTRTIIKRSADLFPRMVSDGVLVYEGTGETYTDQNLSNGKTCFYSAFAFDNEGNCSGPVYAEASLHVPPVKDFQATCDGVNIILTWQNPANIPYWEGIRILRSQIGCTEDPEDEDGIIIYEGTETSYTDTDVTQGQTYHYCAYNFDDDGVFSQVSYTRASLIIPIQTSNVNTLHRSGQTFITWEEVNAYYGEHYRIYRHTAPITNSNIQQSQLLATVREGSSGHLIEQAHPNPFQSHFIIENLGSELSDTTGFFVNTILESGIFYYAVTTFHEGSENSNDFTANNSLLDGIVEKQTDPRPVVAWESDSGYGRVYTQFMDYHDWNPEYDGYAYNYSVSVPEDYNPIKAYPVILNLEEYGSRYTRYEKAPYNLRAIYIQVDDPVMDNLVLPREATWYFGYKDSTGNSIRNFTEERILRIIHDLIADPYYNVDENRICAHGYGMGGNGALSLGMRYPNIFALILALRPITNLVATSTSGGKDWVPLVELLWGTVQENLSVLNKGYYTEDLQIYNGEGIWDWQNHQQYLNQHRGREMAYIGASHRINDEQIDVQTQAYPFYDALDFTNRGYMGHIYEQGSQEGRFLLHPNLDILNFHKGYSFPAFSALSLIYIPDSGLVEYNLDLEWSCPWHDFSGGLPDGGIIDTPDKYEVIVRSTGEEKMINITPRRCQQFVLTPGESCSWLNIRRSDGQILQGGLGMADNHGLITLVGVRITTGQGNLIRISSQVAPSYSGDILEFHADPGDGHVKLSWQNPDSEGWIGTLILRSKEGFPPNPYQGDMVYQGMDDFHIDNGLYNGTTYYYAAFAFNQSFEYSNITATDSATPNSQAGSPPLIIDHICTDLSMIPAEWVNVAKNNLRVLYGHTSYGSQIISGMEEMATDLYSFTIGSQIVPGSISIQELNEDLGTGGDLTWQTMILEQLQNQNNNRNVIILAWGDGVSDSTEEEINIYLQAMSQLEQSYPGITFVYMTAHLDGTGEEGNLFNRNNQIMDYCLRNGKILFDFADIESYDPDGNYFLRLGADAGCYYNNGTQNLAKEWCTQNPGQCSSYYCAHSHPLNCDLKGRAFWWMMARIAGWDPSTMTSLISLRVSHKTLSFDVTGDGSNPPSQHFMINCCGDQMVNYTIDDDAPWIRVSPTNGVLSNEDQPITASVDVTGLQEGIYTGTITINVQSAENSPAIVPVTLTIAVAGEDTIPPAISDIIVVPSSTGVVIHWKTGEPADSQIHYGLTTDYSASTSLDTNKVLLHSKAISGLIPGTTYHFQIDSSDSSLNKGVSTDFTFTTGDRPFSQATGLPIIMTDPLHLIYDSSSTSSAEEIFVDPDRLWTDIDIEPDNPGYPDLVLSNATLQEGPGVDIHYRRVGGGASFTINVFVLVDMEHAEEGRDVDRDLIGVRLTGSPETIPDDDQGLATGINLRRGYDNRMLLDGGSALLDMVDTEEVLVFDFSMAEFLERPEGYEGPTIDMDTTVALGDISPLFDWEVYQFEIDSSDLYPGRWRFIADVDPDNIITEYYETANNSLDISPITLGDPPVITLFEFVDQPDPLRASICSGQRVIVHYAIDSDFPVTARIRYEGQTLDLRDPSEGTMRIGPNYGPKKFSDRITLEAIGPGGTDERTLLVHYLCDGVDFSDIPWAENWVEAKERLPLRQRAVMEYWSRKDLYPWELDRAAPDSAWGRATDSIGVCIAYLWRAYNDPTLSAGDRSIYIQMVNHYLNSTGIFAIAHYPELEATEIGTCNQSMKRADIGGEDYDFRLRLFTLLTYLFKDEYNSEVGHALTDESKRKLMSELLTVDGDSHHTIIETERGLEEKLYDLLTGPWEDIPESLHDKAEDCRTYGEYFCMNGVHLPTYEKDGIRDIIEGLLEETENHILMSETSRYLKNQLITSSGDQGYTDKAPEEYDDNEYNNRENGFNDWIRRHLKGFMVSGFNEYNSNTYSGYSISALSNLYDFAQDPQVKKAAKIVLDFHAARFATQSFDLKQCVGFNRKPKYLERPELWFGPMTSWYAVLMGNYASLQEDYDGIWQWRTQHMFPAAATSYTIPDLILDLAIDKSHNPYEIRVNHTPPNHFDPSRTVQKFPHSENIEILSARRGYLLTAGGRYSEADYWYTELLSQFAGGVSEEDEEDEGAGEHHGWPHPTTLIVRNGQRIHEPLAPAGLPRCDPSRLEPGDPDDYLIYSWGTYIHDENRNNTAVWRNFAAGTAGFHIPCQYRYDVVYGENLWKFYRLSEPGLYVAIHHSSGILEVVDDEVHGGPTFDAFRSNAERQRIRFGNGTYETIDGHRITYNVNLSEGEPPGRWPISHINGEAQEQDYHDWPFIESIDDPDEGLNRVLWADGYGLAIVNNPYMSQSLILSLVDWRHPIRIPQGCPAEDITTGAGVEATARASSAHNAIDDDPATNWPIWGSTESLLTIDLGCLQTFKFISIRYSSSSGYSRIDEITIETSSNGTDFTPVLTRDVHPWLRKGIDIEIPQHTTRYVRLRFNCEGIVVRINEIEIFRYEPLYSVVSPESRRDLDPYEINDTVSQAIPIVPGALSDPSIHSLDDIDYFEVDLLARNTIQTMIEYDLTMSLNIELWGISYGSPDPVLLASGTGEEIDDDKIKRYAEWTADSSPWRCYIRISPETGIIGGYTLTIQTRGPELEPDFREDREVVWEYPVHLSPEPDPVTGIPTAELTGRNIHTGGPWNTWRPYWGEVDYFSVIGQRGYDVRVTITPTDPDAGQPHAFPREDPRISRFIDNRSEWPETQVLTIRPTYGDVPSMRVCFGVKGSHNENYRKDTGGYNLKVELTYAIPDMAVIEDFYTATDSIEDDLAESFELPEIPLILELGVSYEFEAPSRPGDPYLMHIQSKTTGETIYSYELDSSLFSSPEEFTEAADYFIEIHSPVLELTMTGK